MNSFQVVRLNRIFLSCLVIATIAMLLSLWAEHMWRIQPCKLCQLQRIPLLLAILVSILGLCTAQKRLPTLLLQLSLLSLIVLAGLHLLVQLRLISDPCAVPQNITNMNEFKAMLAHNSSCEKISWKIFGIPASAYTFLFGMIWLTLLMKTTQRTRPALQTVTLYHFL